MGRGSTGKFPFATMNPAMMAFGIHCEAHGKPETSALARIRYHDVETRKSRADMQREEIWIEVEINKGEGSKSSLSIACPYLRVGASLSIWRRRPY